MATSIGALHSQQLYKAWGESRYTSGTLPTRYTYTGQYSYASDFGLVFYGSRFYDPYLNRWTQPDTIIPQNQGVQAWDRYAYVNNSPLNYTDPTGHWVDDGCSTEGCSAKEGQEYHDYVYNVVYGNVDKKANAEKVETVGRAFLETAASVLWEPADWALTARDCFGGDCSPFALLGLLPLIPSRAGKYVGETADTILGRAAHTNYPLALGPGYKFNQALPSGLRPDAVDWQNHVVRELKPDSPRAIQRGWNQVRKYMNELFEITGDVWTAFVDTYSK